MTPTLGIPEEPFQAKIMVVQNKSQNIQIWTKERTNKGFHPKDLDEQIQDPQEEPLRGELSDGPIPELMKVSRTTTAGHAEQEVI
ncbi:UNVERIFIED_CONTAM: hypothetical protein Sangu_1864100 [Sesamum angustifolium]|uniref:Uncharacterized protein n=1 Tax=Sesamum angustifolium TaxID=2727405 RepID=A0AAW2LW30_9LAMI